MEPQENALQFVRRERLLESPLNPRKHYDQKKLQELADSIKGVGIIQPIVVRIASHRGSKPGDFEIVAGSRRYRAAGIAELAELPTIVRDLGDQQVLEIMVIENDQSEDTNPLEQAAGYKALLGFKDAYDVKSLAHKIGQSEKFVYDRVKLLELIPEAKRLLLAGKMTAGHAILLARLYPDDQKRAIDPDAGGLFTVEHTLFDDSGMDGESAADMEKRGSKKLTKVEEFDAVYSEVKHTSVREFDHWIATHVRLDYKAPIVPDLFPETAAAVEEAFAKSPKRPKIIQITHEIYVQPAAKEGLTGRIFTGRTWKLADGTKGHPQCDKSALGVIVLGAQRGEKLVVCANKDCKPHWGKERAEYRRMRASYSAPASAEPKKGESPAAVLKRQAEAARQKHEELVRQTQQDAWNKAQPKIIEACAAKFKTAKLVNLMSVVDEFFEEFYSEISRNDFKKAIKFMGEPKSAEALGRVLVLSMFLARMESNDRGGEIDDFSKRMKQFGVDVPAILKEFMPKEKPQASAKASEKKGGAVVHALHGGTFKEPTCIHCGCTEGKACVVEVEGTNMGCSWTELEEQTNRGLCTSCSAMGHKLNRITSEGKEGKAMATKAKKKASKKKPASKKRETHR
jgi:ParB/RepB/Spo0J family partition protein